MTITTEHQSIIPSELICIDCASSPHLLDCQTQKGLGSNISNHLHQNYSLPFQNTENRDFLGSTTSPFPFSLTSKVSLVHLHFSTDQSIIFAANYYTPSDQIYCLKHCRITYLDLFSNLPDGKLQFKQFDYPEPVYSTYPQPTQPSPAPIRKCISTSLTPKTAIPKSIEFIAPTPYAEMTVVFPQPSCQKSSGCILIPYNKLKRLYTHLHQYNPVPNVLQSPLFFQKATITYYLPLLLS